jgi:hypothetical protein
LGGAIKKKFEEVKRDIIPKVVQTLEKGQRIFLHLLNKVEFEITKILEKQIHNVLL